MAADLGQFVIRQVLLCAFGDQQPEICGYFSPPTRTCRIGDAR